MFHFDIGDVNAVSTEVTVAKLIAAAANQRDVSGVSLILLRLLPTSTDLRNEWSRRERDALLLCVDRAASRVYPPLDPLQYTQTPPEFLVEDTVKLVRLHVTSSLRYFHFASELHRVEGSCLMQGPSHSDVTTTDDVDDDGNNVVAEISERAMEDANNNEEAGDARRRWRRAAWLTARIFNEGSWYEVERRSARDGAHVVSSSSCDDVLEAAMRYSEKRLLHVDVFGMELIGSIVGFTPRYAYVAVPFYREGLTVPQWILVSRVGIPPVLTEKKRENTRKRGRSESLNGQCNSFCNEKEVMSHDEGPLLRLAPEECIQVTLRAHKVYCKRQNMADDNPTAVSIIFEDVAVLSYTMACDGDSFGECLTSFSDVLWIVRESCARFARGYKKYTAKTVNSAEERLFAALTDTVSVRMKKIRSGDGRSPVTVSTPRDISTLFESTCVEFKAKIGRWHETTEATSLERNKTIMNLERIRHTVAAMASTLGGVLLVGVTDDGEVIGHPRDALRALRLSGFCPAMAKGNVKVTEMRAMTDDRPATMPKEWWKKTTQQEQQTVGGVTDRVVTVVTVDRGQAPFYATSRHSVPYMRGLASTVPMHVVICARRVVDFFP